MSGIPDDRYDDRPEDGYDDRRRGPGVIERARATVSAPAIGLIVVGIFSLLSIVLGVIQYPGLDAQFDESIREVENNPNLANDAKQKQIDMMKQIRDVMKTALPILWVVVGIQGIVTIVGGLKLKNLTGRGWVITGSILSMIPCTSGCCLLGLVFGIWALVALGKPDVKAAYAANGSSHPDDQYMR
jgi:hypothetical protein